MKCDKCVNGLFTIFTSTIECPHCDGQGTKISAHTVTQENVSNYYNHYKNIDSSLAVSTNIRNYEIVQQIRIPIKEMEIINKPCVRTLANRNFLDSQTEISVLYRNYTDSSGSNYIYEQDLPRIHIGKCFDYYNIDKFYKDIRSIFPLCGINIGGSYYEKR